MANTSNYARVNDFRSMEDYEDRQARYDDDDERPETGRYPIADRYREDRQGNKLSNTYANGDRYNDRFHGDSRYGGDSTRRYGNREVDFDRSKRDRTRDVEYGQSKEDYSRNEEGSRDRAVPQRRYSQDRYSDYPPPGVEESGEYEGTSVSRERYQRRGRDYDRAGRDYRDDRERSPLVRHDTWDKHQDRYDDRSSRGDDDYDRCGENWMTESPTNTIIMRGLPLDVDEKLILQELAIWNLNIKDVRLMRKKATGTSRGFAFVEFKTVDDAQRWMDESQGRVTISNQLAHLYYSSPKQSPDKMSDNTDWTCSKCCAHNFKRRDHCYICGISRGESERAKEGDGFDHIGSNPCNTLIFRGLDALTTEATLKKSIRTASKKKPKNVKVMTDSLTGTSLGFAFAEFTSVKDTALILDLLQQADNPFEVDGKLLLVAYAKNTFTTIMATFDSSYYQPNQSQWSNQWEGQYYDYNQYYNTNSHQHNAAAKSTNSAAALAQAAIQQAQAAKTSHAAAPAPTPTAPKDNAVYPAPDTSKYQYDQTSGYYYDASTGLYYDAATQYYYNNQTCQFLYWSAEKSTYLPAPTDATPADTPNTAATVAADTVETKKDKEKREKAKVAKKIAKDMEKWARSQNSVKLPFGKAPADMLMPAYAAEIASRSADAGFSLFEKSKTDQHLMPPPPPQPMSSGSGLRRDDSPGLVASYGGDSDDDDPALDDDAQVNEENYLDWDKLICQLCKRQFNSSDMLRKHKDLSDLHKQNMAKLIASKQSAMARRSDEKYRDRAAERRQKYGAPKPPDVDRKINFPPPVDMRQSGVATQSEVANKMMQKMGWSEGQGLGKGAQGIVDPVQAKMRSATAGLGARGASYDTPAGVLYKEAGKMSMFARFNELE